jgi:hypothetical protein
VRRSNLVEVVLLARLPVLLQASRILHVEGVAHRHSRPRRGEGLLRVAPADGQRSRMLLRKGLRDPAAVVGEAEAAWYRCHACGAAVTPAEDRCRACGVFVGDPHGG